MPDENKTSYADETLESQAEVYLEAQKKLAEATYDGSMITIVLGLMPADDHPQGRLGVLSGRNDQDAPLFGRPLRGEELLPLLEFAPVARLLTELKALLPQRVKEREQKDKEKERQAAQTTSTASTTKAKTGMPSGETQVQMKSATKPPDGRQTQVTAIAAADQKEGITAADHIPPPQPQPAPAKTTQLTLF